MSNVFRLDFGTTNSVLSINNDGKIEIIDIDEYKCVESVLTDSGVTEKEILRKLPF